MQSGRAPLNEIMSVIASVHVAECLDFHCILIIVDILIGAGADINVVDSAETNSNFYYSNI